MGLGTVTFPRNEGRNWRNVVLSGFSGDPSPRQKNMDWIHALRIDTVANLARQHVGTISFAMATSLVVILSKPINAFFAKIAGSWHFVFRTLLYVLVFTAGYASLNYWSEKLLRQFLADQKPMPLLVLTAAAFLGFGIWAGQSKNIK